MATDRSLLAEIALGSTPTPGVAPEASPSATDSAATASDAGADDEVEYISAAEALAALERGDVPHDEAAAAPEPSTVAAETESETPDGLTDEERRELEEYRALKATQEVAQAEQSLIARYTAQEDANNDFFDREIARIEQYGAQQGWSQAEIDGAIYKRVELGDGSFGVPWVNPRTGQTELLGRIQTERELANNLRREHVALERSRTLPSAFETITRKYTLTDDDRTALAAFQNYPPAELEKIAQALHAKNQRLTSTANDVVQTARRNVAANLTKLAAPGVPGQAPKQKRVQIDHTRASTKFIARELGLMR